MTTPPARPTYPPSETELDAIYLRLAAAFRRLEARRTARAPLPVGEGRGEGLPLGEGQSQMTNATVGNEGDGSRRGPYRRRTALASETARGQDRAARPAGVTAPGHV